MTGDGTVRGCVHAAASWLAREHPDRFTHDRQLEGEVEAIYQRCNELPKLVGDERIWQALAWLRFIDGRSCHACHATGLEHAWPGKGNGAYGPTGSPCGVCAGTAVLPAPDTQMLLDVALRAAQHPEWRRALELGGGARPIGPELQCGGDRDTGLQVTVARGWIEVSWYESLWAERGVRAADREQGTGATVHRVRYTFEQLAREVRRAEVEPTLF